MEFNPGVKLRFKLSQNLELNSRWNPELNSQKSEQNLVLEWLLSRNLAKQKW